MDGMADWTPDADGINARQEGFGYRFEHADSSKSKAPRDRQQDSATGEVRLVFLKLVYGDGRGFAPTVTGLVVTR